MTQKRDYSEDAKLLDRHMVKGKAGVTGFKESIHGPDGEFVDFRPTKAELKVLARYYLERFIEVQRFVASTGTTGSWEVKTELFCWARYCSISEALGERVEEFEATINQHEKEIAEIVAEAEKHES